MIAILDSFVLIVLSSQMQEGSDQNCCKNCRSICIPEIRPPTETGNNLQSILSSMGLTAQFSEWRNRWTWESHCFRSKSEIQPKMQLHAPFHANTSRPNQLKPPVRIRTVSKIGLSCLKALDDTWIRSTKDISLPRFILSLIPHVGDSKHATIAW